MSGATSTSDPRTRGGPADTHPDIDAIRRDAFRRMSAVQKLRIVSQLSQAAQRMALARIRRQHPEADEREQRLRLASLRLDRETMVDVFGWDPKERGY